MHFAGSTRTSCCKTERQRGLSTQLQVACSVDLLIPLRAPLPLAHRRQPVQTLQPATAALPTRRVLLMGVGTRSSNSASAISTIGSTRLPETYLYLFYPECKAEGCSNTIASMRLKYCHEHKDMGRSKYQRKTCSVEGCTNKSRAYGKCDKHNTNGQESKEQENN